MCSPQHIPRVSSPYACPLSSLNPLYLCPSPFTLAELSIIATPSYNPEALGLQLSIVSLTSLSDDDTGNADANTGAPPYRVDTQLLNVGSLLHDSCAFPFTDDQSPFLTDVEAFTQEKIIVIK